MKNALIIFVRNPILGKVKTRIAKVLGDEKALEIYKELLAHTHSITKDLEVNKYVFYGEFIDQNDLWENEIYHKSTQESNIDLGVRMACAFRDILRANNERVIIIGSDCLELTSEIINNAFSQLADNEAVIGKATDGGYYLLGFDFRKIGEQCAEVLKATFYNKQWSHENVANEALEAFNKFNLKYAEMPVLNDVDEVDSLEIKS
jgi:uncharacterized protein